MHINNKANDNGGAGCTRNTQLSSASLNGRKAANSIQQHHINNNANHSNHHNSHKKHSTATNSSIWTTNTSRSSSKSNFTSGSNDFHFIQASDINNTKSSDVQNGSTAKLLPYADDQSNSQV